ncbi:hypothetical protein WMY93_026484 [Mugilogobius chulae]|uniref:Uncharacterized protein n=1 Tax=Mugilogobius chulae TaxID=88201 RepID=A0AAW0N8R1_9GOBI
MSRSCLRNFTPTKAYKIGLRLQWRGKGVHHKSDVVRSPAEKEHSHHSYDDSRCPLLLKAMGATAEPVENAGVAEDEDSRGQQETHYMRDKTGYHRCKFGCLRAKLDVTEFAFSYVASIIKLRFEEYPVWDREERGKEPNNEAAALDDTGVPPRVHLRGMDNGQVTVQTYANQ